MTHYGRDKSDALSTFSRPINPTTTYNYDDTMHITDAYANNDYGVAVPRATEKNYAGDWTQCEMLDGGCYNQNYPQLDNYMSVTEVPDTNAGGVALGDYWDQNVSAPNEYECGYEYEYAYDSTQQNTSPQVFPLATHNEQQSESFAKNIDRDEMSMGEGTYVTMRKDNRFGARLPAAPATTASSNTNYRILPQAVAYQNVHNAQYNMNGHTGYAPNAGLIDERIGSFISLPAAAPLRMLPHSHSQSQSQQRPRSSQQLFKDGNNTVIDVIGNQNQNMSYDLTELQASTPKVSTGTSNYEVFCRMSRPYTSMLPIDYTDYSEYRCHSDNLSTYSDTPPMSNAQHKIQEQRKISLMMAMTTASVIASGETRVPAQHQSQQRISNYPVLAAGSTIDSVSCSERRRSINIDYSSAAVSVSCETSSVRSSNLSTTLTNAATTTTTTTSSITTRKLPKRLPSPQYKSLMYTTIATTTTPADIPLHSQPLTFNNALSLPQSEKNYRPKQLPKLPMPKTSVTEKVNSVPISSLISDIDEQKSIILSSKHSSTSSTKGTHPDCIMSPDNFVHLDETKTYSTYICGNQPNIEHQGELSKQPTASSPNFHKDSPSAFIFFDSTEYMDSKSKINSSPLPTSDLISSISSSTITTTTATSTTTTTNATESNAPASSFDISEYLKPYKLNSIKYRTDNQNDNIPTATTSNTQLSCVTVEDESLGSLKLSLPLLETTHMPYSVTTWTASPINTETTLSKVATAITAGVSLSPQSPAASRSEIVITPLSDSSSTLSYLLSKPAIDENIKICSQNEPTSISHDKVTTSVLSNIDNVLTTTVHATAASMPTQICATTSINDNSPGPTQSYVDYMKKFELPELPPILDICSNYSIAQPVIQSTSSIPQTDTTIPIQISDTFNTAADTSINTVTRNTSTISMSSLNAEIQKFHKDEHDEYNLATCQLNQINTEQSTENKNVLWFPSSIIAPVEPNSSSLEIITGDSSLELKPETEIIEVTQALPEYLSGIAVESSVCDSAFEDSFYDSFNVDLSALTATIAQSESETCLTQNMKSNGNKIQNSESSNIFINELTDNQLKQTLDPGLKPYNPQLSVSQSIAEVLSSPQKTKVTSAANSVLGGLSKGIKGGLDGVLSGVSSTMESTNNTNNSKKSFGFGLASKLVPNVGGLLSSSNRPTCQEEELTTTATTITNSMTTAHSSMDKIISKDTVCEYEYEYENAPGIAITEYPGVDRSILNKRDSLCHIPDDVIGNDNLKLDDMGFGDGYGMDCNEYSAYTFSGDVHSEIDSIYIDTYRMEPATTISNEFDISLSMKVEPIPIALTQSQTGVGETLTDKSRNLVSSIKKGGSSAASGGMFGNIFGKAAAAVQSATQAVNQGASSVAAVVAQKSSVPSSYNKPSSADQPLSTISPHNNLINSVSYVAPVTIGTGGYHTNIENDFNHLLIHQDPLCNQYPSDDYTNSNSQEVGYDMSVHDPMNDNIYYTDDNHSQQNDIVTTVAGQKMLPTVPSAVSTGKKLPTINGKSGLLIKQQPTEIIDDESDDDIINDFMMQQSEKLHSHEPSYCIDSEQDDYYLDQQQTTPPSRIRNDYYEHVSTSYDYREDIFNEEDEYKYLEQQREQQQQQYQHQEHQQHHKILKNHKQPSLDYIDNRQDDDDDDFLDENYQSDEDDCGNYLDESSSGSVGVVDGRKAHLMTATTTTTTATAEPIKVGLHTIPVTNVSPKLTGAHQLFKKQDSIIIDEGDSELVDLDDVHRVPAQISPDKEADEDDKLTDLVPTRTKSQRKKVLMRGETEEVVSGHMQILRKPVVTAKQRWHWAYNKIIMQLNATAVSTRALKHIQSNNEKHLLNS